MKITHRVRNADNKILGSFDNYQEALELVLKLGDRSILASIV